MNYFKGIIECKNCGKKYNFKNNTNNNYVYICQTRKNYGTKKCDAPIIKEEFLTSIVKQHCEIHNKLYSESKIKLFVKKICIDKEHIKIFYKDGTSSEVDFEGKIVF